MTNTTSFLYSKKALFWLILPMVGEQALALFIGLADTIMVSSISEHAVSAVSLVDSINVLFIQLFAAMATGGAVVIAQYLGRRKLTEACSTAKQLLYVTLYISLFFAVLSIIFCKPVIKMLFGDIEVEITNYCHTYFYLSAFSYPALALYNGGAAILRSMGNSKTSMYVALVMNVLNVAGNALFIYVFNMEVAGAGLATLISRILGAVAMLWIVCKKTAPVRVFRIFKPETDFSIIKKVLKQGVPNGIESSLFQVGRLLVAGIVATFSTAIIAANAVGFQLAGMSSLVGNAVSMAVITVVGQCAGAKEVTQAKYYTKLLMGVCVVSTIILNAIIYFALPALADMYHLSPEGNKVLMEIMHLYLIATIFFWTTSFALPNALRAAGDSKYTMLVSIVSIWIFRIGFSYFGVYVLGWGLVATWYAMFFDWICRTIFFVVRFYRGKWLKHKVI